MLVAQRPITLELSDFSGGLNARDGVGEVAPNELRDGTLNWTLDEREAITARKGCPAAADFPVLPGNPSAIFYSSALTLMIVQVGTTLYKCAPGGGSWTSFRVCTTSQKCGFADFGAELVFVHGSDGTWTYDGAAATVRQAGIGQVMVAVWQNKVWTCAGPSAPSPYQLRIHWSATGDSHTWTVGTNFVDIREKDDRAITSLFGGPTLVAFKEGSHYRINDSTTGAYSTVDWNAGAISQPAVVGGVAPEASGLIQEGGIFFWGLDGLYAGDGLRPAILVGDKLRPRFVDYAKINATTKPLVCAGIANGRVYFAFPKTSTTQPDTVLEYHPRGKWLVEHQIGTAKPIGFASYSTSSRQVTVMADAAGTKLIELCTSDTRTDYDASSVALTLKTGFIPVAGGLLARMRKAVFTVSATVSAAVTFAASYLDDYDGSEKSIGLTFGAATVPAGTSETRWNGTARAPAFSFTLTASGVAVTLRRIVAKFYPAELS